jgi:hypothetical protein
MQQTRGGGEITITVQTFLDRRDKTRKTDIIFLGWIGGWEQ